MDPSAALEAAIAAAPVQLAGTAKPTGEEDEPLKTDKQARADHRCPASGPCMASEKRRLWTVKQALGLAPRLARLRHKRQLLTRGSKT